jgi:rod shape-determining protein MreD
VKTIVIIGAIAGSVALQSSLLGLRVGGNLAINLVLIAVVYLALSYGPVTGMLAGMVGGLAQDTIAGGIIGIGGLCKTLIGFLVGVLGSQFNLSTTIPRLVMFIAATFVHELLFEALHALVGWRPFTPHLSTTLVQALVNSLVGVIVFAVVELGPEAAQRRRMNSRASLSRRRF